MVKEKIILFLLIQSYFYEFITPLNVIRPAFGGKTPISLNDPYLNEAASFAMQSINLNGNYIIKSAFKQIVSGTMYYMDIVSSGIECTFQVLVVPWINQYKVIQYSCFLV